MTITVAPGGSQVLFHTENTELISRLIDGKFPDMEPVATIEQLVIWMYPLKSPHANTKPYIV